MKSLPFKTKGLINSSRITCIVALMLVYTLTGCTLLENMKGSGGGAAGPDVVKARRAQLTALESKAVRRTPVEVGMAHSVLEEMEYFSGKGNMKEVKRLDVRMAGLLGVLEGGKRTDTKVSGKAATVILEFETDNKANRKRLEKRERDVIKLEKEVASLKKSSEHDIRLLTNRLESVRNARDVAIQEVVRTRGRIQGMASGAEANAMFAEARVLLDRMEEEASSREDKETLKLVRTYLDTGKAELDQNNPGGAAYLFDLISSHYQHFRESKSGGK